MSEKFKALVFLAVIMAAINCYSMSLVDKYSDVKIGDWVSLELTNGTKQLLFIADKDDKTVTIEVKEMDRGFLVSWRQLVIDIVEKKTILVREKDPVSDQIKERLPDAEESIDEVLQAQFRQTGEDKITQKIEEWDSEKSDYISKTRTFECKLYRSVIDNRFVEIWYSDEISLYPIKANIPGLNTTIRLVRYGTGVKSKFQSPDNPEDKEQ